MRRKKGQGQSVLICRLLTSFFKFIIHSQDEEDPTLQVTPALLKSFTTAYDLAAWRAVIRKHYKDDEWRRQLAEMRSRLRPEDVRDINQTKLAKKAYTLLKKAPHTKLTIHKFCLVRDFLIASLEFQNGQRPGPFKTILLEDFQNAEIDQNSGTRTIYVPQHKTSTAGPAPISMSRSLSKKMETYLKHVCTIFPLPGQFLSITNKGNPFPKGKIG